MKNHPEAGVHFQGETGALEEITELTRNSDSVVYNREKDKQSATGQWFAELSKKDPWYKDVVPNVSIRAPVSFLCSLRN